MKNENFKSKVARLVAYLSILRIRPVGSPFLRVVLGTGATTGPRPGPLCNI